MNLFTLFLKPNTHRQQDETVLSRRVGGVYMNSRRLPTDSAMRTHNAAVGRDRVYNTAANGSRLPTGVFTPTTRRNCRQLVANSCTHRRRDETRQFRLVGVGSVYWALVYISYCLFSLRCSILITCVLETLNCVRLNTKIILLHCCILLMSDIDNYNL